jgi:hypothetical protein
VAVRFGADLLARRAFAQVVEALSDTRVVVVNGARQVGKSTLAEAVLRDRPGGVARFLDDAATRAAAEVDPTAFVRHGGLLLIDEVQRVPDLWLAIKHEVDRNPRPGSFLLTGSARLLALRALPDALVGRAETIELWPLSQGEIDDEPDGFVDAVFADGTVLGSGPSEHESVTTSSASQGAATPSRFGGQTRSDDGVSSSPMCPISLSVISSR